MAHKQLPAFGQVVEVEYVDSWLRRTERLMAVRLRGMWLEAKTRKRLPENRSLSVARWWPLTDEAARPGCNPPHPPGPKPLPPPNPPRAKRGP